MAQLGKIRRHHWKERFRINKLAKFESDTSWGKFVPPPPPPFETLRSHIFFSFQQINFTLGTCNELKVLFPADGFPLTCPYRKLKKIKIKKRGKAYRLLLCFPSGGHWSLTHSLPKIPSVVSSITLIKVYFLWLFLKAREDYLEGIIHFRARWFTDLG